MAPPSIASSSLSLAVLFCTALLAGALRPNTAFAPAPAPAVSQLLTARLDAGAAGGMPPQQCWSALVEMKSCTGQIILFLLDGEAYLGPGCCRAVRVIERSCWAANAVMSAVGFTPEEGDMLKGYCNDNAGGDEDGQGSSSSPLPGRAVSFDGVVDVAGGNIVHL